MDLNLNMLHGVRSKHNGTGYFGKILRQIAEFMPGFCSEEEEEILDVLKQLTDYDISTQTVRKIE